VRTIDVITVDAPLERTFAIAADVERWPEFLPHYRWVRMLERNAGESVVEMAAWRPFGPLRYPTWWVSRMRVEPERYAVRYQHVQGVTRGMDVEWRLTAAGSRSDVTIVHEWTGPQWPLIGRIAAEWVIGPVFIHGIASRTLAGVKRRAEAGE
jgi:ribosome-associated toxin RatA of RatAB toxin-antitoxin module